MSNEPITYSDMCKVIAEDWSREQEEAKRRGAKDLIKLTGEDIWNFDLVGQFPALYVPIMYNAAKNGNLLGLMLTDNAIAGMFDHYIHLKGITERDEK